MTTLILGVGSPFWLLQSFLLPFVLFSWGLGKFILRGWRCDCPRPLGKANVCSGLYRKNTSTLSITRAVSATHSLFLHTGAWLLSSHIRSPLLFWFSKKPGIFPNVPAETRSKQAHILGYCPTCTKLRPLYLGAGLGEVGLGPQMEQQRPHGA